jgi:hypothetical protein
VNKSKPNPDYILLVLVIIAVAVAILGAIGTLATEFRLHIEITPTAETPTEGKP